MSKTFRAIVAEETADGTRASLKELALTDLPDNDVLVAVDYSTLNYKDGLAVTGTGKICRRLPMVCGIDLAGSVLESNDPQFAAGDRVLVNGFGLSETHWGGYSQRQRLRPEWLVKIPDKFSAEQAMAIGTAGYTSMLCVQTLIDRGVQADSGPVVVTGASGGVGSVAVMLLAKLGYEVCATSGRASENETFLKALGATEVIERSELSRQARPLEAERWAGAVDGVGGDTLATVLAQTKYAGTVAACGLAGGMKFSTTVMPFILRNVTLAGVDSVMAPLAARERAWQQLAELVDLTLLSSIYTVKPMGDVVALGEQLLAGTVRGRIVIDVNA